MPNAAPRAQIRRPIRVLVVDDSLVIRGLITRILRDHQGIEVVASVADGQMAVERVKRGDIDVIVLDIEMPVMDGLAALPLLLAVRPAPAVIMASTLTTRNADISIQAMRLGALDYVPKPTSTSAIYSADDFKAELTSKVVAIGCRHLTRLGDAWNTEPTATKPSTLRKRVSTGVKPRLIAVGSSTGGPRALTQFLGELSPSVGVPVVVTQHMPPTFTTILAEHLSRDTHWTATEAREGEPLLAGRVYIAPGDFHLSIVAHGQELRARIAQGPKENFCRPAVDVMLRSAVEAVGSGVLVVMLTGMGQDGLKGSEKVVAAGGTVIAQDEASSVVWGMPGAVAAAGLCTEIGPIDRLARDCEKRTLGART